MADDYARHALSQRGTFPRQPSRPLSRPRGPSRTRRRCAWPTSAPPTVGRARPDRRPDRGTGRAAADLCARRPADERVGRGRRPSAPRVRRTGQGRRGHARPCRRRHRGRGRRQRTALGVARGTRRGLPSSAQANAASHRCDQPRGHPPPRGACACRPAPCTSGSAAPRCIGSPRPPGSPRPGPCSRAIRTTPTRPSGVPGPRPRHASGSACSSCGASSSPRAAGWSQPFQPPPTPTPTGRGSTWSSSAI